MRAARKTSPTRKSAMHSETVTEKLPLVGREEVIAIRGTDLAAYSIVTLCALFFCANALRAQDTTCSKQAEVLEQQLTGHSQELAARAAKCIGDNAGDFVETFHVLIDTVEKPAIAPPVQETSIWAGGRIAE